MSDQNTSSDAMTTLGTIIGSVDQPSSHGRDAVHLAVVPAIAGIRLTPGERVLYDNGVARRAAEGCGIGLVDPFLARAVEPGERFWIVVYPRTIRGLRHVWTHPELPDEPSSAQVGDRERSERWLREFCDRADCPGYDYVMESILDSGGQFDPGGGLVLGRDAGGDIPPEFWDHVEAVLNIRVVVRPSYFTCSC